MGGVSLKGVEEFSVKKGGGVIQKDKKNMSQYYYQCLYIF